MHSNVYHKARFNIHPSLCCSQEDQQSLLHYAVVTGKSTSQTMVMVTIRSYMHYWFNDLFTPLKLILDTISSMTTSDNELSWIFDCMKDQKHHIPKLEVFPPFSDRNIGHTSVKREEQEHRLGYSLYIPSWILHKLEHLYPGNVCCRSRIARMYLFWSISPLGLLTRTRRELSKSTHSNSMDFCIHIVSWLCPKYNSKKIELAYHHPQ